MWLARLISGLSQRINGEIMYSMIITFNLISFVLFKHLTCTVNSIYQIKDSSVISLIFFENKFKGKASNLSIKIWWALWFTTLPFLTYIALETSFLDRTIVFMRLKWDKHVEKWVCIGILNKYLLISMNNGVTWIGFSLWYNLLPTNTQYNNFLHSEEWTKPN